MEGKTDPKTDLTPAGELIVTDLEAVRALTDQTKMKILEAVGPKPVTVKQIAASLKMVPNNLYYHINQLESLGLIKVFSTRVVSGIIEKQYIAAARTFTFSRTLISQTNADKADISEVMNNRMMAIFEMTKNELQESIQAGLLEPPLKSAMRTSRHKLTQPQLALLMEKLEELMELPEFEEIKDDSEGLAHEYRVNFNLFPLVDDGLDEEDQGDQGAE